MPVPWLRLLDLAIGVTDLRRGRPRVDEAGGRRSTGSGIVEARLAGLLVGAIGEVFERSRRQQQQIDRERLEEERRQAERERKLAVTREAGDREIGRLRLVAGLALAGWIGSLFITTMLPGASTSARVLIVAGWVLLLAAMTSALAAQANLADALAALSDPDGRPPDSGLAGVVATWLLVSGLGLIAIAALMLQALN